MSLSIKGLAVSLFPGYRIVYHLIYEGRPYLDVAVARLWRILASPRHFLWQFFVIFLILTLACSVGSLTLSYFESVL